MKNLSTGAGLAVLGIGIALHPLAAHVSSSSTASASTTGTAATVAAAASAQAGGEPTVVWMGATSSGALHLYHRLWSDGRLEVRRMLWNTSTCQFDFIGCDSGNWTEVPAPPGGNGFACRTDINGDRAIDGADLTSVLNAWGQQGGCGPEPTYPCLDLGDLVGNVAGR